MASPTFARLVDETHRLPLPGVPGAFFPAEGRLIDADDDFWRACLADGSLIEATDPAARGAKLAPQAPEQN